MRRFIWILAAWPALASAQEVVQEESAPQVKAVPLTGEEIEAALSERTLFYPDWPTMTAQTFYASGRTLYDAGRPEWGYWAVREDQYCSQWPPSDGWTCYDMARFGAAIRFISEDGSFSEGFYEQ